MTMRERDKQGGKGLAMGGQCFTNGKTRWMVFTSKMFEKHLWKSDILIKDADHRPASLLKMALFHRCFSNLLLVKTNYLVSA